MKKNRRRRKKEISKRESSKERRGRERKWKRQREEEKRAKSEEHEEEDDMCFMCHKGEEQWIECTECQDWYHLSCTEFGDMSLTPDESITTMIAKDNFYKLNK